MPYFDEYTPNLIKARQQYTQLVFVTFTILHFSRVCSSVLCQHDYGSVMKREVRLILDVYLVLFLKFHFIFVVVSGLPSDGSLDGADEVVE